MRITFAGVGEAFDEHLPNTSLLVESDTTSVLLDCGFTAASAFWRVASNPLDLDAVFISHFHGDHYFGIPALLVRSVEEGRTKPLTFIGQPGVEKHVRQVVDLAYPNVLTKAEFDIDFRVGMGCQDADIGDMNLSFALADHPMPCQAVRVECGDKAMFYSGDGRPTPDTQKLASGCNLVVHESFSLAPETPGHGTVDSSIAFAREAGATALALVHVKRSVRAGRGDEILQRAESADGLRVFLPDPGELFDL